MPIEESSVRRLVSLLCLNTLLFTAVAPAQRLPLEGEYTDPVEPDTPVSIYWHLGSLTYESERHVPVALEAITPTEFRLPDSHTRLVFGVDNAGHITGLTVSDGGQKAEMKRTGEPVHHPFHKYKRREVMIPMRDGIKLHAVILEPRDIKSPLPFLIQRTPYGVDGVTPESFVAARPELARDGYIYVAEDIRGRFGSQGEFLMMRPLVDHSDRRKFDESTDASDTVAWLLKHGGHNNGRAGFVGTSYPGFLAMMAGIDPHPAVKAISPQAPMIDVWQGDDFFHNGAFRQGYGYDYVYEMETSKRNATVTYGKLPNGNARDGFDFFLDAGSFAEATKRSGVPSVLPTWQMFFEHPAYDRAWQRRGVEQDLTRVSVPTLTVGGTYDQEDMYGPQHEYSQLEAHDSDKKNFLVLGPWRHGSWNSSNRHLGAIDYTRPIGKEFRKEIEARFFGFYLKDEKGFNLEDTASFRTGTNTWERYSHFPPAESHTVSLHLAGGSRLRWDAPSKAESVSYVSDPSNPVAYRHRPIQPTYGEGSQWYNWLTEDQRFVTGRPDVATWVLSQVKDSITVTGEVVADLYATTTGTDGDWVVKLIDQYPENDPDPKMRGYQRIVNAEIFRGRYLKGFDHAEALKSNSVNHLRFSLHDIDHTFLPGHRIVVQVQSSWFPIYDRNPQRFVPNIMTAKPEDYQKATVSVLSGPGQDSRIELPVNGSCSGCVLRAEDDQTPPTNPEEKKQISQSGSGEKSGTVNQ